jgi:hypothetical protein
MENSIYLFHVDPGECPLRKISSNAQNQDAYFSTVISHLRVGSVLSSSWGFCNPAPNPFLAGSYQDIAHAFSLLQIQKIKRAPKKKTFREKGSGCQPQFKGNKHSNAGLLPRSTKPVCKSEVELFVNACIQIKVLTENISPK